MEGGLILGDHSQSGTLRLTNITVERPKQVQSPSAFGRTPKPVIGNGLKSDGVVGTTKERKDGNTVFKYEEAASEQGMRLTIFYWIVVNPVPPHHARVATFSYTILAGQRNRSHVQRDLEMLEAEIQAASFSPQLGVVAE